MRLTPNGLFYLKSALPHNGPHPICFFHPRYLFLHIDTNASDMAVSKTNFIKNIEEAYKKYYGSLCYYAQNYVQDAETAQDLVQDVFVRIIETRQNFESPLHCRNFLYLSVKNACLNHLDKENVKKQYIRQAQKEIKEEEELPDDEALLAEVFRKLKQAVDKLPTECRKIFHMSYFENQDNETIARQLSISINTVRAQKARGKQLLREKLKDLYPLIFIFPGLFQ